MAYSGICTLPMASQLAVLVATTVATVEPDPLFKPPFIDEDDKGEMEEDVAVIARNRPAMDKLFGGSSPGSTAGGYCAPG